jgi:hypothetical protein
MLQEIQTADEHPEAKTHKKLKRLDEEGATDR